MRLAHRLTAAAALFTACASAMAHEGHGWADAHWHATDTSGFAFVALLAGFALWLSRGE